MFFFCPNVFIRLLQASKKWDGDDMKMSCSLKDDTRDKKRCKYCEQKYLPRLASHANLLCCQPCLSSKIDIEDHLSFIIIYYYVFKR